MAREIIDVIKIQGRRILCLSERISDVLPSFAMSRKRDERLPNGNNVCRVYRPVRNNGRSIPLPSQRMFDLSGKIS